MNLPAIPDHAAFRVVLLFVYISLSTFGLYHLKQAALGSLAFVIGFIAYGVGFLLWMVILRTLPLSIAFPSAAGGLIVATQLTGRFVLDETLSTTQNAGVLLVFVAVVLLYWPSETPAV